MRPGPHRPCPALPGMCEPQRFRRPSSVLGTLESLRAGGGKSRDGHAGNWGMVWRWYGDGMGMVWGWYGDVPAYLRCTSGKPPVYLRCISSVSPFQPRDDFGTPAVSPPKPGLFLPAFVWPLFKGKSGRVVSPKRPSLGEGGRLGETSAPMQAPSFMQPWLGSGTARGPRSLM